MEMDFVAVDDWLALFIGRHEGGEAADGPRVLFPDQNIPQLGRTHFAELLSGAPFPGRVFVVVSTCLLNQVEAGRPVGAGVWGWLFSRDVFGLCETEGVLGAGPGMGPLCGPGGFEG